MCNKMAIYAYILKIVEKDPLLRLNTLNDTLTFLKPFILLYADDTVLLADSAQGLQKAFDGLSI